MHVVPVVVALLQVLPHLGGHGHDDAAQDALRDRRVLWGRMSCRED